MTVTEPTMDEVMAAVAVTQSGDHSEGRRQLLRLWNEPGLINSPQQRCIVAHFLADTEKDVTAELAWDLLALESATGEREGDGNPLLPILAGFLPSLHLNVGDAYRRAGDHGRAWTHVKAGLRWAEALPDDGYARMIKTGLDRLQARLLTG